MTQVIVSISLNKSPGESPQRVLQFYFHTVLEEVPGVLTLQKGPRALYCMKTVRAGVQPAILLRVTNNQNQLSSVGFCVKSSNPEDFSKSWLARV